jgi:DNA-binding GntR family transcriptional regulator
MPWYTIGLLMKLSEKAYEIIRQRVASGELEVGSMVSELALAKDLGFSRTPVREAIRKLVDEGLFEQVPRFGTIVRAVDWSELFEYYEMREALEGYAAALAAPKITDKQIAQLELILGAMAKIVGDVRDSGESTMGMEERKRFMELDLAFHMLIVEVAGNRQILKTVREGRVISDVFLRIRAKLYRSSLEGPELALHYHRNILDALKEGNAEAAGKAMAEHIRTSRDFSHHFFESEEQEAREGEQEAFSHLPSDVMEQLRNVVL